MVTCRFYSLDDNLQFLDKIKHLQSLIGLSMQDYLPESVLDCISLSSTVLGCQLT